MEQLDAYLATLPLEQRIEESFRLQVRVWCPYWRPVKHGRVRCRLLDRVAVLINSRSEHFARRFYRKHPKALQRDTGFLIGDAVKECNINRNGPDFSFPESFERRR